MFPLGLTKIQNRLKKKIEMLHKLEQKSTRLWRKHERVDINLLNGSTTNDNIKDRIHMLLTYMGTYIVPMFFFIDEPF